MKIIAYVSLILLFASSVQGIIFVDIAFDILKGVVERIQTLNITEPECCYAKVDNMHRSVNEFVTALIDITFDPYKVCFLLLDVIDAYFQVSKSCIFHNTDEELMYFHKHPGDLIGRIISNYKVLIAFFNDIIQGFLTLNFHIIGNGFGDIILVVFESKIL